MSYVGNVGSGSPDLLSCATTTSSTKAGHPRAGSPRDFAMRPLLGLIDFKR